ncbi:MAG: pyridoxine 5'-phosphate synthase [Candidatus Omnitrophota bacterium]|nr:pyridoxine 5'-phosphate synthase [Candidatus Omnitrophota bacterium]
MNAFRNVKLGINIDHIATLRQARLGDFPKPWMAARAAELGGADGITVHLREDRRHIQDFDLRQIKRVINVPMNLEMALSADIIKIALWLQPEKVCIVPEKRRELTTEGGLNVIGAQKALRRAIPQFQEKGIEVSLFIDPVRRQIEAAHRLGVEAVELHTGTYANAKGERRKRELRRITHSAQLAHKLGLKVHAGHGLDYQNVRAIAFIPAVQELNIGHSIIGHSVFVGLKSAVREMKRRVTDSRKSPRGSSPKSSR